MLSVANLDAYILSPTVIPVPVQDGSMRLLDLDGYFCAISKMGAQMLHETLQYGPATAARQIAHQYGVAPCEVQVDLQAFLRELEERRLIRRQPPYTASPHRRRILASGILRNGLTLIDRFLPSWKPKARALLPVVRLSFRLLGWTRTVAMWTECARPRATPEEDIRAVIAAIESAVFRAMTKQVTHVTCRERALCCWALARWAGVPAALVLGISLFPLSVHCWCESRGQIFGDEPDFCKQYMPVARYE